MTAALRDAAIVQGEPSLEEMLTDRVIEVMLSRDGVRAEQIRTLAAELRRRRAPPLEQPARPATPPRRG